MSRITRVFVAVLASVATLFGPIPNVQAQSYNTCNAGGVSAFAGAELTIGATASGLDANVYNPGGGQPNATVVHVFINTNNVRVRFDGQAPTTTVGAVVVAGSDFFVCGFEIAKLKMIRDDSSDVDGWMQPYAPAQ